MATPPHPVGDRPAGVSRRAMLTASAAAGLSGLCAGYVALTRPLLRPAVGIEQRPFQAVATASVEQMPSELAQRFLPDQPWAATAEYEVRNGHSSLFFNTFEPVEQGTAVRIEPFAMVFPPRADRGETEALTLVGEAAILRVAGSIDLEHADPGRIIGATISGAVRVRGADGLDIQGSNFTFSEEAQRLWSDEPVAFAHRANRGRATGIQLELFRVGDPRTFESVAVSGIDVVRLLRDVEMELLLEGAQGSPFAALGETESVQPEAAGTPTSKPAPEMTTVRSAGPFTFDLKKNEASFVEQVVASRPAPGSPPDILECDVLAIVFEPGTPEAKQLAAERRAKREAGSLTEADGIQAVDDALAVRWIIARPLEGRAGPTVLQSPSNELRAEFATLAYDAATGVTTLTRDGGAVDVHQATSRLVSPRVVIEPGAKGEPANIQCEGKGWLRHFDDEGRLALSAQWSERLRRSRNEEGFDLVRLSGSAQVVQPQEEFTLAGDLIDLLLDPREDPNGGGGAALAPGGRMQPVRLVAESLVSDPEPAKRLRVKLRSRELWADAKRLDVTFVPAPAPVDPAEAQRARLSPASGRVVLTSATGPPPAPPAEPAPVVQPRIDTGATAPSGTARPAVATQAQNAPPPAVTPTARPPEPIELAAEVINVVADRPSRDRANGRTASAGGGQVREVHTTGGVIVRQKRGADEEPLVIRGDRLDLFNRGKNQELVHIFARARPADAESEPEDWASVNDQGATLFGFNINLDRRENRAWVEGAGILEMPAKGAASALRFDDNSAPEETADPEKPETITVWWHDSMQFQGDQAVFYGDVLTEHQSSQMSCEEMEIRLTRAFDFGAAGDPAVERDRARPEVAEIICRQGVRVSGHEREEERLVSVRQARFAEFRLDQRTGDTTAVGPGYVEMWRRGDGNRASLTADNAVRANATVRRGDSEWEYLRIDFRRTSDGNIRRKSTTFRSDVRVVYGPVADHTRTIDPHRPDRAPAGAGWMSCGTLTLTRHDQSESAPAWSEVLGEENVRVAGRGFSGLADRVSYDESKGQYVLKSFGKRVAMISYNGEDERLQKGEFSGQQIEFYPATGKIHAAKATGGSAVQ